MYGGGCGLHVAPGGHGAGTNASTIVPLVTYGSRMLAASAIVRAGHGGNVVATSLPGPQLAGVAGGGGASDGAAEAIVGAGVGTGAGVGAGVGAGGRSAQAASATARARQSLIHAVSPHQIIGSQAGVRV